MCTVPTSLLGVAIERSLHQLAADLQDHGNINSLVNMLGNIEF